MALGIVWSLLSFAATAVPQCGPDSLEACRELLLAEINAERAEAELAPVVSHPVLERIARDRALEISAGSSVEPDRSRLRATTRRIYRDGYIPHDWSESVLIGRWGSELFSQWREVRPHWYDEIRAGDYEHVGIGVGRTGGLTEDQPVLALMFGLTKRTMEWRRAAPLADLAWVRKVVLGEVNDLRRASGRQSLAASSLLDAAAQAHAEDMLRRAYYDHRSPDGQTVKERVREAGEFRAKRVAENIAKGLFTPDEMVRRWMNSSGHRGNILWSRATEMGSGVAFGENDNGFEVVWVQVFSSGSSRDRTKGTTGYNPEREAAPGFRR